jgi:hypothetical protein
MPSPVSGDRVKQTAEAEHIGPDYTGDNISAKKVAGYQWDGTNWVRSPLPLLNVGYDYFIASNPDGNGNYQTYTYKSGGSGGTIVRTLTYTYDVNNNVTSMTRT